MKINTKQCTAMGMICALAYIVMVFFRFPIVSVDFLKYDPKDIIIVIGGFIWGPASALYISLVVSIIEMITVSNTEIIGCIMNVISTCAFACTASAIYKARRSLSSAVIGLIAGCFTMTAVMLLWNYLITPIYTGWPRAEVAKMLLPVFMPFNLLKASLNAGFAFILYKPVISALRRAGLIEPSDNNTTKKHTGLILLAALVIVTCILIILVNKNII